MQALPQQSSDSGGPPRRESAGLEWPKLQRSPSAPSAASATVIARPAAVRYIITPVLRGEWRELREVQTEGQFADMQIVNSFLLVFWWLWQSEL